MRNYHIVIEDYLDYFMTENRINTTMVEETIETIMIFYFQRVINDFIEKRSNKKLLIFLAVVIN